MNEYLNRLRRQCEYMINDINYINEYITCEEDIDAEVLLKLSNQINQLQLELNNTKDELNNDIVMYVNTMKCYDYNNTEFIFKPDFE